MLFWYENYLICYAYLSGIGKMKKFIVLCLAAVAVLFPLSFCFADGAAEEDHICFSRIDSDHDGWATPQEFEKFYQKDPEKFQKMDQDNDGKLSHDEYEEYLYNQEE